jgi:excisionase family DNA binding protein
MENLLLTPIEAAEVLGISRTTLYGLMKDGTVRRIHIGRSARISYAELQRYVAHLDASDRSSDEAA